MPGADVRTVGLGESVEGAKRAGFGVTLASSDQVLGTVTAGL